MAIMPGAVQRLLPSASTSRIVSYDILCAHTMVGSLAGTDSYFRQGSGVNSHFGTGGDGTIYQWVDTAYRSGANLNGNHHIISIENADMGPGFAAWNTNDGNAVPAFTPAQIEANAKIAAWANKEHGIPLDLIPDSKPGRRGVGYHRQGVPGYMVVGGEKWSNSAGKVCPGNRRIAQVPQIIDRARQLAGGAPASSTGGFLMALTDAQQLRLLEWADKGLYTLGSLKENTDRLPAIQAGIDGLTWGVLDESQGLRVAVAGLYAKLADGAEITAEELAAVIPDGLAGAVADELQRRQTT